MKKISSLKFKFIFINITVLLYCQVLSCQSSQSSISSQDEKRYITENHDFIIGNWIGTINAGTMKFTFGFRFWTDSDKILRGTLDLPEQDLKDVPVDEIIFHNDSIKLDIRSIQRKYHAVINNKRDVLNGIYIRNGEINFPLILKKTEKEIVLKRPQTPVKPYPYREEEVLFINGIDSIRLAGTLSIPDEKGPFQAVVLISGSGAQDRDESAFGHKPFLIIADYLTRNGIAVLRFDDRGVGGTSGDHLQATVKTNSDDVISAVEFLESRKEVDIKNIGLIGHSEGGIIASMAANKCSDIRTIILLGAPGLSIEENLYRQNAMIRRAEGASENIIEQFHTMQKQIFSIIKEESDDSIATEKLKSAYSSNKYSLLSQNQKNSIDERIKNLLNPYFKDIIKCDPAAILQKVHCPLLAVAGEKDLQASPKENLAEIDKTLKAANNKNYRLIELPGLNHMMQTCQKGTISEYSELEETISPSVLKIILEWLNQLK